MHPAEAKEWVKPVRQVEEVKIQITPGNDLDDTMMLGKGLNDYNASIMTPDGIEEASFAINNVGLGKQKRAQGESDSEEEKKNENKAICAVHKLEEDYYLPAGRIHVCQICLK